MSNLLTKQQLAKHLQVSEMTIDRWRKKGLPWTRIGVKLVRFDLNEVIEWMEQQPQEHALSVKAEE